ncbi:hypothetical protein BJ165DRAFT_423629 [Panaeolus papilionaceus]|nr:hypothetical protein BJ165DRAFT_423629 [Panaeolus papilionaceus]
MTNLLKEHDNDMCITFEKDIENLLIFAGLISAVVTAFAVEIQKLLEVDPNKATVLILAQLAEHLTANVTAMKLISQPFQNTNSPSQSLRVNVFVFTSLVLSLGTALIGIIILQWIRSYRSSEGVSDRERIALRQIRYTALVKWKVHTMISSLPFFLGLALLFFFIGLIDFLQMMDSILAAIVGTPVAFVIFFLLITTILPTVHIYMSSDPMPLCPYQSSQSWLCYKLFDIIFFWGNKRTPYCKNWTELILDLHKQSIILDPRNGDKWLKNALVQVFTKFNSSYSFLLAYHCLQSVHNMNFGWDIASEVIGDLKESGEDIWRNIQSALPPVTCTEFISTLLLFWNCPLGPRYTLHRSELFYRCVHTFSQFNSDRETWPEYKRLLQLWWNNTGSISSNGATSSLGDQKAYLATFLIALESNPVVGQDKLTFNLFWKFLALRVQDENAVPTVLDCLRILTRWLPRVEQLPPDVYQSWDDNFVLRYSLRGIFDFNVFSPSFVTPELYTNSTFTAFLDIFIDPQNERLKEGWRDAVQASWSDKWDDFLLESRIDHKYWELSANRKKLEQRYSRMMRTSGHVSIDSDEVTRLRTPLRPASNSQVVSRTLHPDQARQNDDSSITSSPERSISPSLSAVDADIDTIDPSAIPLKDVRTHAPANVPLLRPPLPHTPSASSLLHPPGQTRTPEILQNDDQRPLLPSSDRLSLDPGPTTPGDGGTASPPSL